MKPLAFTYENTPVSAELGTKITKELLYGKRVKVQHANGVPLEKRYITLEGEVLPTQAIANEKIDSEGSLDESPVAVSHGTPVTLIPSSFVNPRNLTKAGAKDLTGFIEKTTYQISLPKKELAPGLYKTDFLYKDGYESAPAYLDVREGESFLRIGQEKAPVFIGKSQATSIFDADDEAEEDSDAIDFGF